MVIEDVLNAQHMAILLKMVQVWWLSSELSLKFSDLRFNVVPKQDLHILKLDKQESYNNW